MNESISAPPLPDRLPIAPRSPHHWAPVFEHGIVTGLNDQQRFNVVAFCLWSYAARAMHELIERTVRRDWDKARAVLPVNLTSTATC